MYFIAAQKDGAKRSILVESVGQGGWHLTAQFHQLCTDQQKYSASNRMQILPHQNAESSSVLPKCIGNGCGAYNLNKWKHSITILSNVRWSERVGGKEEAWVCVCVCGTNLRAQDTACTNQLNLRSVYATKY